MNARKHWELRITPDEFYQKEDPFNVKDDPKELEKVKKIISLIGAREFEWGIDMGCGEGAFTKYYKPLCKLLCACDISKTAIHRAVMNSIKERSFITFFQWDIRDKIDNYKETFDLVLLNEVLYYIPPEDLNKVVENIYYIMKPHAAIVVSVGRYFEYKDIVGLFKEVEWGSYYKSKDKDYSLIMCGEYVPARPI